MQIKIRNRYLKVLKKAGVVSGQIESALRYSSMEEINGVNVGKFKPTELELLEKTLERSADTDIQQNAIVGVFLRTLERYRGILFLTTNRATVIDDAIVSRLTAHIRYTLPSKEELIKIWEVLSVNYQVDLDLVTIQKLAEKLPMSGRSVKNMLKLASVVLRKDKKQKPTVELFQRLSKFQDIETTK